ncbi:MAG: hypothetical protein ACM3SW_03730 [Actinomycetota bacterium]
MKQAVRLLMIIFGLAAISHAGVTVSSPTNGSTVGSPVHVVASASSSQPITVMRIYVDYVSVYKISGSKIDTLVPMSAGKHNVVVQAWDSAGTVLKQSLSINVTTAAGVTVSSPTNGSTVGSPVHIVASASSNNPITVMRIYVDYVSVYKISGSSIDTSLAMSAAKHNVVVQAWDSAGTVYKQGMTITVTQTSTGLPTPPSSAITKSNIDQMTGWQSCSACAGAGGSGPVATFSMTQNVASPSLDGKSAKFFIGGTTSYSDALWWKQLGAVNTAKNFKYDLYFYLTTPQYAQALEFDTNQAIGTERFIFGTQCNIKTGSTVGHWDVWGNANGNWLSTGIACSAPSAFKWHHLTWEFKRTDTQLTYVGFTYDGVTHYVNRTYTARPSSVKELNVAVQLDGDSAMQDYSEWVDKISLTYW